MMVNILYQFLKELTGIHLLSWFNSILSSSYPELHKRRRIRKTLVEASGYFCLDQQFDQIARFSQLKHFGYFSGMIQWMEKDYKDTYWQLIPVIAPLLSRKISDTIHYICAILDFVSMADYTSHTNKTL